MNSIKDKIKEKVNQDDKILLLEKGKRGILNVIFGRSMLMLLMMLIQVLLLVLVFRSLESFIPYIYGLMMVFYGVLIVHLVNDTSNPAIKISWILLIVLLPAVGVMLYLFV